MDWGGTSLTCEREDADLALFGVATLARECPSSYGREFSLSMRNSLMALVSKDQPERELSYRALDCYASELTSSGTDLDLQPTMITRTPLIQLIQHRHRNHSPSPWRIMVAGLHKANL